VKAVVLVGGEGTRLRPLTLQSPKPLLPIANQAFLERQLEWLAGAGVTDVVLSLGYLPDAFQSHFPNQSFAGIAISYAIEPEPLGTAGGIRFAAAGIDERLIVCNGDVLTNLDLGGLVAFHEACGAEATINLTQVEDPSAFGVVPTRPDGQVIAFVEKPPRDEAPTNWINAGTYILEPSVLAQIPPRLPVSIERVTFPRMLEEGRGLFAVQSDCYWIDIGTPDKYLQAHRDVLRGAVGLPPVHGAQERAPGIWVQGTADIDASAQLIAPVLIGTGAMVAANAVVHDTVLGANVTVGANAHLERSVVLDGGSVGAGARVIESVIGPRAQLGASATIADQTVLGADAHVAAGARLSGGRVAASAVGA
jgi:mannose-1-phosphate guanylyltransferase